MKASEIIEWVLIFLAIGSLWYWILGYRTGWHRAALLAALVAMIWVAVRRLRRVRSL